MPSLKHWTVTRIIKEIQLGSHLLARLFHLLALWAEARFNERVCGCLTLRSYILHFASSINMARHVLGVGALSSVEFLGAKSN